MGDPPDPPDKDGDQDAAAKKVISAESTPSSPTEEMDVTEVAENTDRALVVVGEGQDRSWAEMAAAGAEEDEIKDVLRIVLKKTDKSATFYLSDKQKGILIFQKLDIPKEKVVGIDQEDFRTIRVHMNTWACPWKVAHSIQVKEGLVTLPMRMFRRKTRVRIQRAGVGTDKQEIRDMLSHFGSIEEDVQWSTFFDDHPHPNTLSEEERMMRGIKNGDATVQMFISKQIPNFGLLPCGRKVRIKYNAQPATCARCHQGIRGCKGNANASKCEKAGGKAVPLAEYWAILTAETESQREEGEETAEIPGNVLLVEGLGKEAGIDWLKQFLGAGGMTASIETGQVRRSKDKYTWQITGLSPVEIRDALEGCSGTQYKGRTVYCTPVVANGNSLFESQPESGQGETEENSDNSGEKEKEANNDDDNKEGDVDGEVEILPLPPPTTPNNDSEKFEVVESKSAEKRRKKEEKQMKLKADKAAELAHAKLHGLVDSDGENKSPPKNTKSKGKITSKRSSKEAGLSPPQGQSKVRQTRERTASQRAPNQTGSAAASQ